MNSLLSNPCSVASCLPLFFGRRKLVVNWRAYKCTNPVDRVVETIRCQKSIAMNFKPAVSRRRVFKSEDVQISEVKSDS